MRMHCLLICALVLVFSACGLVEAGAGAPRSYRELPGITQQEIAEVAALRNRYEYFTYAMLLNEEAFFAEGGEVSGFSAWISEFLSEFFEIPMVPVIVGWGELISGLEDGSIDFTGQLTRTPQRLEIYAMTDTIVIRPLTYAVMPDGPGFEQMGRLPRFAFREGTVTADVLEQSGAFYDFERVYVPNVLAAAPLLQSGMVDAFFGDGTLRLSAEYPLIESRILYPPIFGHASFSAQNPDLFVIVDLVQRFLENGGMSVLGGLYARGAEDLLRYRLNLLLSPEERAFLDSNPVVRLSAEHFGYPVSFYNQFDRLYQGIAFDILEGITMLTGISFVKEESQPYSSVPELLDMLESRETDLIAGRVRPDLISGRFAYPSAEIFPHNYALLSHLDYYNINFSEVLYARVGLISDSPYELAFRSYFPDHLDVVGFGSNDELLDALMDGEIDMAFSCMASLLYLNNFLGVPDYWANIIFDQHYDISFALRLEDEILLSVIEKSISLINVEGISKRWTNRTFDYTSRLMQMQLPWLIGSGVLFVCLVALLSMMLIHRSNERDRLRNIVAERTRTLEKESSLINTVFDSIPDMIFCKDKDFRYTHLNIAVAETFERDRSDMLGRIDEEITQSTEMVHAWREQDRRVLEEGITIRVEEQVPGPGGLTRICETIKTPLIQNDEIIGIIGLSRDISKRKEFENALENVSRAKSTFISNMSHEIRTPMNSIVGFSELAFEGAAPKTQVYLDRIIESARWLMQIIDDILDVSKIESGKMELDMVPFDLQDLLTQCRAMIYPKAVEKGIKLFFYVEAPEGGRLLIGDPVRLRQIFINLLSNAVKFTNIGMIRITSFVKSSSEDSATIYFEVRDSGIGMSQEQIDRAFEPFMQADSSITRRYGGTGLGLHITKNLVEMMGGHLNVNSVKELGSKFSFEINFDIQKSQHENSKSPETKLLQPRFDAEVLVCEDNDFNQMVIEEHLKRLGIRIDIAENGQIGLDKVKSRQEQGQRPYDLIMMDIMMPVMDGLQAADEIIALGTNTPIVAMTAVVMAEDKENYRLHGMKDCVGKPFTTQELWACLLRYIEPL